MNSFQRKSLYTALAGAGALGVAATANAVAINPNGLGQVLIYPYYTVQTDAAGNAYNSLLSVVNTDSSAKAVKVRFLEGKRSQEVLDFNLFLSRFDVWTASITPSSGGGATIKTTDLSCTIPESKTSLQLGVNFLNSAYLGDGGGDGLDRTKEGYVEIIEMATYTSTNCTSIVVTHVGGVPLCQSAKHPLNDIPAKTDAFSAAGGLFGAMTLVDVGAGTNYTIDAVALERFNMIAGNALYFNSSSVSPDLSFANPVSTIYNGVQGQEVGKTTIFNIDGTIKYQQNWTWTSPGDAGVYISNWSGTNCINQATGVAEACLKADATSAALMRNQVMNEFVLDAITKSGTDWVVTFPTKRFYSVVGTGSAKKLFQRNFNKTSAACDDVLINIFDREERFVTTPTSFSPPPAGAAPTALCFEANVITFNGSGVLGSKNQVSLSTTFANGWMDMHLPTPSALPAHRLINGATTHIFGTSDSVSGTFTYQGLPTVGFAVESFVNGTLVVGGTSVLANFGGTFNHKYTQLIN